MLELSLKTSFTTTETTDILSVNQLHKIDLPLQSVTIISMIASNRIISHKFKDNVKLASVLPL